MRGQTTEPLRPRTRRPHHHLTSFLSTCAGALVLAGILTALIRLAYWLLTPMLVRRGLHVASTPRLFGSWWVFWLWGAALFFVSILPRSLLRARRVARRSRELQSFVLWRRSGMYQLHHPDGGLVPVEGFGLRASVRAKDLELAQWMAADEIIELTGRSVTAWEADRSGKSSHDDASWVAQLGEPTSW